MNVNRTVLPTQSAPALSETHSSSYHPHAGSANPISGAVHEDSTQSDADHHDLSHGIHNIPEYPAKRTASALDSTSSGAPHEGSHEAGWCAPFVRLYRNLIPYGGVASGTFSLCSVTLGGGIISMPSSFASSGIIMAMIYLVVVTILTIYTMTLMGYAMEKTGLRNYEEMGRSFFGKWGGYFTGGIMALSCVGTAIGYISAADSLVNPMLQKSSHTSEYFKTSNGNHLVTTFIWLLLMLPVVIPKRVNSIRYVSSIGVTMVMYFVLTIVIHSITNGMKLGMRDDMEYFTTGNKAIYGLSIFVFAYMCQGPAYSIYFEMKPKPSVKKLTLSSIIGLSICMIFYILAGVFGLFDFAGETEESVLFNFDPIHEPYVMVAYIGMLIKICAAYAMNMIPIRNFLYYCISWDLDTVPYWKHSVLIVFVSGVMLITGLFIPSVNLAFGLVGSLTGGFVGFIFPAYFWMYSGNWSLKTVGIWHYLATYTLLVVGVIAIVFGSIATIYASFFDS
ncbi:unnamed protein product [Phytomonas sp. EM1]|nr:unnamed protein product [Phytomonas sp. EM1]|eukprot:CCW59552.1 unnamed protein product [Phytomonas sp. isolate EM1]